MSVKLTTAYFKIKALKKKIRIVQGGSGSAKTMSILTLILEAALTQSIKATIVTATYPLLRDGAMADMKFLCRAGGIDFDSNFNKMEKDLIIGNSIIQFRNLDNNDFHKGKGVRRDILYLNEGNRLTYKAVDQLLTRSKVIYIDHNPDFEYFAHTELKPRPDADFIILDYRDNELLSVEERTEIENRIAASKLPDASDALKNWVLIYGFGQLGSYTERTIYNYRLTKDIPITARRISSGMDFGESPDRTALIDMYIDGHRLYIDEVFCENNLRQEHIEGDPRMSIVARLNGLQYNKGQVIIADSASAVAIRDLRKHGYHVIAVAKNQGAQRDYINKIRGFEIYLTERSVSVKKDMESFFWKEDSNGKIIPEPQGHEPDTLAAMRYGVMGARL